MTSIAIFLLGVVVTAITATGAILIGLQEASDPEQSRLQDLTKIEKDFVGRGDEA